MMIIIFTIIGDFVMRTFYHITSAETGKVILRCRKVAKALRWWLRMNGHQYDHGFFMSDNDVLVRLPGIRVKQSDTPAV